MINGLLKRTNSIDKPEVSKTLTKRLTDIQTNGIISTHDLKLTGLQRDFPKHIQTLGLEISIKNNKLNFDYRLKEGVSSTLNADFLMRMMGVIPTTR